MAKPRASWNTKTDTILLDVLFEQHQDGLQTSNGNWHKSTWTVAKTRLAGSEVHSGGGPKTVDSCKGCWDTLKKSYKEVKIVRDESGFGWDDEKKLVTADESVWDKLLKAHPQYKKWMTHPFPLFDEMADLMEGTYATGKGVVRPGRDRTPSAAASDSDSSSDHEPDIPIDPATQTPAPMPSNAPADSSTAVTTSTSGKRQVADTLESASVKRARHGHKKSGSQAIEDMASSIDRLASAFAADAAVPSPARKRAAIHAVEDDGDLSDDKQIQVFRIIHKDTGFADTILSICKKDARTRFIKRELYPLPETD